MHRQFVYIVVRKVVADHCPLLFSLFRCFFIACNDVHLTVQLSISLDCWR